MSDTDQFSDLEILARTIYGEARNQPELGKQAVACVVMNRVKIGGWWGDTVRDICLKPFQFSCWNENDPNRAVILAVANSDFVFAECLSIAGTAIAGTLADPTGGADHYLVRGTQAAWAKNLSPIASIGAHDFYQTV